MFNLRTVEPGFLGTAAVATPSSRNSSLRRLKWLCRIEIPVSVHEHR
jgi:hypothetical protein